MKINDLRRKSPHIAPPTVKDGSYAIILDAAVSNDPDYSGLDPDDVTLTNIDDDTAGINVSPVSELETTEAGGTDVFHIVLASQPTADVTVDLTSNDTGEGTVSAASVVFTSSNWNTPQTVTITGQDDAVDDEDVSYTIVTAAATSDDSKYAGMNVADVSVVNLDDDTAEISISPTSGLETTEGGGTDTFQIVLASEPTASVTVGLMSSDTSEGTVSTANVVFTPANWNTPQTVTITGQDDSVDDGDAGYAIVMADASSSDPKYAGSDVEDVSVINRNDDTAGVLVSPTSGLKTTEAGGTVAFEITLASQPLADVTLSLESSDTSERTVSAATLTFNNTNWSTPQTVTIIGQDDEPVDGDVSYTIATTSTSGDSKYEGLNVVDVTVTNRDDDSAALTLSSVTGTADEGSSGTVELVFEVSLAGSVEGGFRIAYATDDDTATTADGDYVDNDGTLVFAGTNGETKTISVRANGDSQVELDERLLVSLRDLSQISPSAADRISIEDGPATGEIRNDDTATMSFAGPSSVVIEAQGSHAIDVVLDITSGGTLGESLTVNVSDLLTGSAQTPQDYTLETSSVTFGAGSGDKSSRQVDIAIVVDETLEEEETVRLGLSLDGDGIGGAVALATPSEHDLTITDDPMTAVVSGIVWVDANNNGVPDANEATIPGVVVSLEGKDLLGRTVKSTTITDSQGRYQFVNLPGGTYTVMESQPEAFHDAQESLGTVGGTPTGEMADDRFTGIVLPPAQAAIHYDFGEWGLRARYISNRMFLSSTVGDAAVLRELRPWRRKGWRRRTCPGDSIRRERDCSADRSGGHRHRVRQPRPDRVHARGIEVSVRCSPAPHRHQWIGVSCRQGGGE